MLKGNGFEKEFLKKLLIPSLPTPQPCSPSLSFSPVRNQFPPWQRKSSAWQVFTQIPLGTQSQTPPACSDPHSPPCGLWRADTPDLHWRLVCIKSSKNHPYLAPEGRQELLLHLCGTDQREFLFCFLFPVFFLEGGSRAAEISGELGNLQTSR